MFGKQKVDFSFSVMLFEEVLRAELKTIYGGDIKIFQFDKVVGAIRPTSKKGGNITKREQEYLRSHSNLAEARSRIVEFTAIIGPFERLYPNNPPEDKRRRLRRIEGTCRVFSLYEGCLAWYPHFLELSVNDDAGNPVFGGWRHTYYDGIVNKKTTAKDAENPCTDMCNNQTPVNYPRLNPELHGKEPDRDLHLMYG